MPVARHGNLMFGAAVFGAQAGGKQRTLFVNEESGARVRAFVQFESISYYGFRAQIENIFPGYSHLYPQYTAPSGECISIVDARTLDRVRSHIQSNLQISTNQMAKIRLVRKAEPRNERVKRENIIQTAFSVEKDTFKAVESTYKTLCERLGQSPDLLICYTTCTHDPTDLTNWLESLNHSSEKKTKFVGGTSSGGVFTDEGITMHL